MAAQLRDEFGNPIKLTDEFGNPVQLTDEHGIPVHVTGIATHERPTLETVIKGDVVEETGLLASTTAGSGGDAFKATEPSVEVEPARDELKTDVKEAGYGEIQRSSTSSSGTSEDDGEGGRRKKKGLKQKLKEKLNIGKHKEEHKAEHGTSATVGGGTEHVHEKKSVIEKIKEKLPGHHSH